MKKIYLSITALFLIFSVKAQIIDDNFENYTLGPMEQQNTDVWRTWSGGFLEAESITVSENQQFSGSQSGYIGAGAGPQDAILKLGNLKSGQYTLEFQMYIPAGKGAYFNIQGEIPDGNITGVYNSSNINFNEGGNNPGLGEDYTQPTYSFEYPESQWFKFSIFFDLDSGDLPTYQLSINGEVANETPMQFQADRVLGGIDFYAHDANNEYWIDDVLFSEIKVPSSETTALQDLYNNTNGTSWKDQTNWNTTKPVSSWFGVTVKNGHVSKLLLNLNNLDGNIPASILNLPFLEEINISRNNLSGVLPAFRKIATINNVNIAKNDFSFADLETNFSSNNSISTFNYETQNKRDTEDAYDGIIGNNYTLTMTPVNGTNVQYQWYKKRYKYFNASDEQIPGATSNTYTIPSLQDENFDIYFCRATSTNIPDLIIDRNSIDIKGEISQLQKDALIAIYNATNGASWTKNTNWLSDEPVSEWHGVTVTGNKITKLNFYNNNLTGTLPSEIGNLTGLEYLSFFIGNNLNGTLPPEVGNLTALRLLSFEFNNFTGEIPASYANLTQLRGFWFNNNQLSGELPDFLITSYPNLVFFDIAFNNFQGTLPDFTSLQTIRYIDISNNHFAYEDFSDQFNDYLTLYYSWSNSSYYSPQTTLDSEETISEEAGTDISLYVDEQSSGRNSSQFKAKNITYTWYKDNVAISDSNANPYIITNAQSTDSGEYHCIIQDSSTPDFETIRATITVNIGTLGTKDLIINGIEIFPNPTNKYLVIKLPNDNKTELSLFDINGKLILQKNMNTAETKIDLTSFENGIYIVTLKTKNFKVSKRIIKN